MACFSLREVLVERAVERSVEQEHTRLNHMIRKGDHVSRIAHLPALNEWPMTMKGRPRDFLLHLLTTGGTVIPHVRLAMRYAQVRSFIISSLRMTDALFGCASWNGCAHNGPSKWWCSHLATPTTNNRGERNKSFFCALSYPYMH